VEERYLASLGRHQPSADIQDGTYGLRASPRAPAGTYLPHCLLLKEEAVTPACCLDVTLLFFFQQGILS